MSIKKARIPRSKLSSVTPIILEDGSSAYLIRFRLISEDKNRKSQWSPIFLVKDPHAAEITYQYLDGGDIIGN